jgi:hypothetical protein
MRITADKAVKIFYLFDLNIRFYPLLSRQKIEGFGVCLVGTKGFCQVLKDFYLPLGLMGGIFLLSSIPGNIHSGGLKFLTELDPQWQNLLHVPLFGLLQWLWLRAMSQAGRTGGKAVLACGGISLGYGVFDEFHQMFIPGRYASLIDMALNLLGVVGATLLFGMWQRKMVQNLFGQDKGG